MHLEAHCKNTIRELGNPYPEIHKWIDAFASVYLVEIEGETYISFEHRKKRHHVEGIEEAVNAFKQKYPEYIIRKVCEGHIRDDYFGYLPVKKDFEDPQFLKQYHG